ncbi:hypothetical protein ONZ45_g17817 [Pleurotus djamor]|nr:hypothetical protein ONZ45_g17817 [Pleurotus djamor]
MTWISTELRSFALELEFDLDDNHGVSSTSSELLQIAKQLAAKTCDQDDERAIHKLDSCIDRLHSSMAHSPTTELMARRRLYTDACVLRALSGLVSAPKQSIGYLDRAIIIAGAPGPGRIDYIHALIKKIQADCLQVSFDDRVFESSTSAKFSAPGPLKLLSASTDIECLDIPPSMASFRSRYSQRPFILRGFAHCWPALQERPWSSLEYLKHVAGPGRVVPVEVGRDYREAGWTQQLMDWEEFLTHIELADVTSSHSVSNTKTPVYLAQHNLFTQFPGLRGDIIVPDYVYASPTPDEYASYQPPGNDDQLVINAWFGPRGTISPAHVDPYFNFYNRFESQLNAFTPTSLNACHITDALLKSPDNGATLDLSRLNLTEVDDARAEELAGRNDEEQDSQSSVLRIALSHNKLSQLPRSCVLWSSLRYLNLKSNAFTDFPDVLTEMASLDTLDISHNHIKRLPSQPGNEADLNSWSRLPASTSEFDAGITPHARSFSVDSAFSMSSASESFQELEPPSPKGSISSDRPPPLHLGILQAYSTETSPAHSPNAYLPSPADSDSSPPRTNGIYNDLAQQHARTSSYADVSHSPAMTDLLPKQSMPDLRTAKLNFTKKRPEPPSAMKEEFSMPSPLSMRQDSNSSLSSGSRVAVSDPSSSKLGAGPSMAFERNSYFRRLSTLPTAVSTALPKPLLCLIDSARSILFAICQVYLALEHYTVQATDDRLPNVLRKVLDPANSDMMHFIYTLDRFDATSRKMLPPPGICRAVVESCKDMVSVFGKAMGVLSLQLKMLANEDVRYLRSLLLTLYGSTAEISCAWQAMGPHIEAIKPLLHAKTYPPPPSHLVNNASEIHPPVPLSSTSVSFGHEGSGGSRHAGTGVARARRHAGSFSSKDVEVGRTLPSYEEMPNTFGGVVPGSAPRTPIPRKIKRQATAPNPTLTPTTSVVVSSPSPTGPSEALAALPPFMTGILGPSHSHSRQGSQSSLQGSSTSSSPLVAAAAKPALLSDLPPSSKVQVDKEALHAMKEAVDVAPTVWDMMDDILADVLHSDADVRECLTRAKMVTDRLRDAIRAIVEGTGKADKKSMRDDAHIFLKSVVQLSNVLKTYGSGIMVPPPLKSNMVKLTNATEEFAILLHVSSFSPSATPRSYSPMLSTTMNLSGLLNPPHSASASTEETRLVSSLSRSRSAQPSASMKHRFQQEPPRSALPSQTFKIPTVRKRGRDPPFEVAHFR